MNENFSSLPQEDRPYERCIRHGVQSLSNRDLLAVILRTGAKGRNVLELAGDLLKLVPEREGFTGIRRLSLDELSKVKGIGNAFWKLPEEWRERKPEKALILHRPQRWQIIIWKICVMRSRKYCCFSCSINGAD